jgi:hypothetical protein
MSMKINLGTVGAAEHSEALSGKGAEKEHKNSKDISGLSMSEKFITSKCLNKMQLVLE